jgi:hypothetical protein
MRIPLSWLERLLALALGVALGTIVGWPAGAYLAEKLRPTEPIPVAVPALHHCTICGCCDELGCRKKAPEAGEVR